MINIIQQRNKKIHKRIDFLNSDTQEKIGHIQLDNPWNLFNHNGEIVIGNTSYKVIAQRQFFFEIALSLKRNGVLINSSKVITRLPARWSRLDWLFEPIRHKEPRVNKPITIVLDDKIYQPSYKLTSTLKSFFIWHEKSHNKKVAELRPGTLFRNITQINFTEDDNHAKLLSLYVVYIRKVQFRRYMATITTIFVVLFLLMWLIPRIGLWF